MAILVLGFGIWKLDLGQGLGFDYGKFQGLGFQINHLSTKINPLNTIQYNLESEERDLSNGDIGFRVWDLEIDIGLSLGFEFDGIRVEVKFGLFQILQNSR